MLESEGKARWKEFMGDGVRRGRKASCHGNETSAKLAFPTTANLTSVVLKPLKISSTYVYVFTLIFMNMYACVYCIRIYCYSKLLC